MVGHHAVDGSVENALVERRHVLGGAQRWVHLEVGVVGGCDVVLVQEQVVRRDLAGHGQALCLCLAHEVKALGRGDVRNVKRAAGEAAQLDVAVDLELLAKRGPAEHAQARGGLALVDHAVRGERLNLAVGRDNTVELRDVLHAGAHHACALHAVAVIGEGAGALHDHVANLGELLALLASRKRTDGAHVAQARLARVVELVADLGAGVGNRVGVGHGGHVSEATVRCRASAGLDGLLVLEAGVAEVHVHVDKAGHQVLAACIDDLAALGRLEALPHGSDFAVVDEHVADAIEVDLRIDRVRTPKQKGHCSLLPEAGTSRPCA